MTKVWSLCEPSKVLRINLKTSANQLSFFMTKSSRASASVNKVAFFISKNERFWTFGTSPTFHEIKNFWGKKKAIFDWRCSPFLHSFFRGGIQMVTYGHFCPKANSDAQNTESTIQNQILREHVLSLVSNAHNRITVCVALISTDFAL